MAATLQYLSGGRLILGLGAGWQKEEYAAYGYDFPSYKERVERLKETIEIIRLMWTKSPATYQGKYNQIRNAYCEPKPTEKIPILVGADGRAALRVVAKLADAWNESGRLDIFRPAYEKLHQACVETGRDISEITLTCIVHPSFPENPSDFKQNEWNTLMGPSVDGVAEELHALHKLGVSHFQVRVDDTRSLGTFCNKVMPLVKQETM